ncbi:uncharacterized protein [Antedon mediterranea]|uniref:uncharacterized protein n=1 Tax=Antedon mediterranea TaxID=105859 RepID=UPI003AF92769
MALTEEQTEQLIIEVEKNSVLYDLSDKRYKDVRHKNDVWDEIAIKVGVESGQILSKKFTNIKDAYVAYLRKVGQMSRSGQGLAGKLRKYKWADQMQFLNGFVSTRRSTSNFNLPDECENLLTAILDGREVIQDDQEGTSSEIINEGDIPSTSKPKHTPAKRKLAKNEDVNAVLIDYFSGKKAGEKNALAYFFESAFKTVETFPKVKQIQIKKVISDAIFEIETELAQCEE